MNWLKYQDTHPAEYLLDHIMLLPWKQRERLAGEATLRVNQEVLEEADGVICLGLIEVKPETLLKRLCFGYTLPEDLLG